MRRLAAAIAVWVLALAVLGGVFFVATQVHHGASSGKADAAQGIRAFAADGNRFVYASLTPDCTVELGSFGSKTVTRLGVVSDEFGCDAEYLTQMTVALGESRAVWGWMDNGHSIDGFGSVETAAAGTSQTQLDGLFQAYKAYGDVLTAVSGHGPTLVYAIVTTSVLRGEEECFPEMETPPGNPTCDLGVTAWKVRRVVGSRSIAVPDAPAAVLLAVSGNRLALVPANLSRRTCSASDSACISEPPSPLRRFEIRSVTGGPALARATLDGTPTAIALSDRVVAVLVRRVNGDRIERFDARTGALKGRTVSAGAADELAASGTKIVWRVGGAIHVLDAATGADSKVATAAAEPIGLTLEGRRIAWADSSGRVWSRLLPG